MKTILKKFATFLCAALVLCACSDDDYSEAHQSLMALIRCIPNIWLYKSTN